MTTLAESQIADPATGRKKVKHLFPCWQAEGRWPVPGDRTYCGRVLERPLPEGSDRPYRGNEHLACVVCVDLYMTAKP